MNGFIKEKRILNKLTQEELSQKSGVSIKAIYSIEQGGDFKVSTLYKIAQALKVEPEERIKEIKSRS